MEDPTYTVELTVTLPASQDGPWAPGESYIAGRIEIDIDPDERGPSWDSREAAWSLYYDEVVGTVESRVDTTDLDATALEERVDDPEGTMEEWLDFGDYTDDAEHELVAALEDEALPMMTWTRLDTGATYQHLMDASDLSHRGEMISEYGFGDIDVAMDDLFPWEKMEEAPDDAEAASEPEPAPEPPSRDPEPAPAIDFPPCPRCGNADRVQKVVRGRSSVGAGRQWNPLGEPVFDRYRREGCSGDTTSDWWCVTCDRGFDTDDGHG